MSSSEEGPENVERLPARSHGRSAPFAPELRELIELEQARIARDDRRTEVMRLAVENSDASDKRQFEYHLANLQEKTARNERRDGLEARRQSFLMKALSIGGGILAVVIIALVAAALLGGADTSQRATDILKIILVLVAGFGAGEAAKRLFRGFWPRKRATDADDEEEV